jgi:1,4-dihydroxy-2-naphthoate octaprenyltransferase
MDTLQSRLGSKAGDILQENPTLLVAMGHGDMFTIETFYFVGHSDEFYCVVKPTPAIIEAVRDDARVAFAVNKGFPNRMLQGTGRAFFLGGLEQHPQVREQILAKIPDAVSFLTTIRNLGVLKILPEQIYITDDTNLGLGPRPAYIPAAAQALPGPRGRWLQAMGVSTWNASYIPVLVGMLLALNAPVEASWLLFIPVVTAAILFQAGSILVNTCRDFQRRHQAALQHPEGLMIGFGHTALQGGVDRLKAFGTSRVLVDGLLPVRPVFWAGVLSYTVATIIGILLVMLHGMAVLPLGLLGLVAGVLYAGWPVHLRSRPLSDVLIFLFLGPLPVIGSYFLFTGTYWHSLLLVSLPIGLLALAVFQAIDLQAGVDGARADVQRVAADVGWARWQPVYYVSIGLSYVSVLLLTLASILSVWGLFVLLSTPLAGWVIMRVWRSSPAHVPDLAELDRQTNWLHLAFGLLLALGLALRSVT